MTIPGGFASRSCFCLWSAADHIDRAIADHHKTYLHLVWEADHFCVDNADGSAKRFSLCNALWSLASYPVGMVGYLFDTVVKIVLLVGNFFLFVLSALSCDSDWQSKRGIIFVDNLAAVGISLIGIIMPPLAYRLDHMVRDVMLDWANSK